VPDRVLVVPACDRKNPFAIPTDPKPFIQVPLTTGSVSVEITFQDGSLSELKTFRR
jgi:hypothetical protein